MQLTLRGSLPSPDPNKPIPSIYGGYRASGMKPKCNEASLLGSANSSLTPCAGEACTTMTDRAGTGNTVPGPTSLSLTVSEQLKLKKKDECFCPNPIGVFKTPEGKVCGLAPCKRWDCPHCGDIKKSQVLDRARYGFYQNGSYRVRFMTLTLQNEAHEWDMGKYWNRLRASLRKHGFRFYRYFWVKERGAKSGLIHMHVLIDAYVPVKLIKRLWFLATERSSYIVDIRAPKHGSIENVAAYMMKYMTKAVSVKIGKKQRRFGFSRHRNFRAAKFEQPYKVRFEPLSIFNKQLRTLALQNALLRDEKRKLRALARKIQKAPPGYWIPALVVTRSNGN